MAHDNDRLLGDLSVRPLDFVDVSWNSGVDGPGRRVVVYLRGCPLDCPWCHSPHTRSFTPTLLFFSERCRLCGRCQAVCSAGVHRVEANAHLLDRSRCVACGACVRGCPVSAGASHRAGALRLTDERLPADALFRWLAPHLQLLGDLGGLTVSGGEPLAQAEAVAALLRRCRDAGVHTAVETSGIGSASAVESLLELVDCWLFGLRPLPVDHGAAGRVGRPDRVAATLRRLVEAPGRRRILIRLPLIPGHTDSPPTWARIAETMAGLGLRELQVLPFNPDAGHYHGALGQPFPLEGLTQDPRTVAEASAFFAARGLDVAVVSGAAVAALADTTPHLPILPPSKLEKESRA